MDFILEDEFSVNLVLEDETPPASTQEPVLAEIYISYGDQPVGTAQKVGVTFVGETFVMDYTPEFDRDLRITLISRGPDGKPDKSMLSDASSQILQIRRETVAPVIGQSENASTLVIESVTHSRIVIGIDGFTRFARFRKVEVASNAGMTADLETMIYDSEGFASKELPRFVNLTRESEATPKTRFVRVSHSSGLEYGPPSPVLEVTFASAAGTGGSAGNFDPIPRAEFELEQP